MINQYLKDIRSQLELLDGKAKYSQSAVARALDCNRSYISRVESGKEKQLSRAFLQKIAQYYCINETKVLMLGGYIPEVMSKKVYELDDISGLLEQLIYLDEEKLGFIKVGLSDPDSLLALILEMQSKPLLEGVYRILANFNAKELKNPKDDLENYGPTSLEDK